MGRDSHPGRFILLASAVFALLAALWAALLRMDLEVPMLQAGLALAHGPLMVSGFLGVLISLERAVALNRWWAYSAPVLTALGTLCIAAGRGGSAGPLLIVLGSAALVANFVVLLHRQAALHTLTIAAGAVLWLVGNLAWYSGAEIPSLVHWWVGFLVLTIAGERLELSRLVARGSQTRYFLAFAAVFLAGLTWTSLRGLAGIRLSAAGLFLLTLWLIRNDVARRTVRVPGLPRFIALHLLAGYVWLVVGSAFWLRADRLSANPEWQAFHYDAMLHTVFVGFVFSMIFAHAPIIFPAVTGRPLAYRPAFYAHGALLHFSLLLRISSDLLGSFVLYRWSGVLNVLAVVAFLANNAYSLTIGARRAAAGEPC